MPDQPQHTADTVDERDFTSATRRVMFSLGGKLAAVASLGAGFGPLSAEAKKKRKKRKKKKKPPQPDFLLQAVSMTHDKEVPAGSGDTEATGSAKFAIKANGTICCDFTFDTKTPDSVVTGTHIHEGVSGVNGDIVVNFNAQPPEFKACVAIGQALANAIKANPAEFYANIHTNKFPDGAVRDQLTLDPG